MSIDDLIFNLNIIVNPLVYKAFGDLKNKRMTKGTLAPTVGIDQLGALPSCLGVFVAQKPGGDGSDGNEPDGPHEGGLVRSI